MQNSKTVLGSFLKDAMNKTGTTKEQLAKAAGISVSTVGQILRGDIKKPPFKRLAGFSAVLRVDVDVLVSLTKIKKEDTKEVSAA